jgi:uncharacterized protein YndB with AHSA1/START domain
MINPSLTLVRRFKVAPEKVYAAWTDPSLMRQWWGVQGSTVEHVETDAREGGRYRLVMRTASGDTHDVSGMFREVVPGRKLVFTWAWVSTPERESLVTLTFEPQDGGTLMHLMHEQFVDEPARDRHEAGWTSTLARLEKLLN